MYFLPVFVLTTFNYLIDYQVDMKVSKYASGRQMWDLFTNVAVADRSSSFHEHVHDIYFDDIIIKRKEN